MVLAVDQQSPAVAVALQVGDVGARDLDGSQRLEAEQAEQRAIAQVLQHGDMRGLITRDGNTTGTRRRSRRT